MQGYLWIIWVKLAGALWITWVKLGSSLIFYFVAIDDRRPKPILVWGTGAPASNKTKYPSYPTISLGPVHMIPLTGTPRLPMISPPIYFPIKFCIVFI
jgi:hypothetical protein